MSLKKSTEGKQNTKKNKSREIMQITYGFVGIFLILMGYICFYSLTHEQELINNSYNSRQELLVSQNTRGDIISRNGEILATTTKDSNGSEIREYPYSNLFSHVVGYSTKGKTGIEALANYYLINSNINVTKKVSNEMSGNKNPGDNVYTTLDVTLQQVAEKALGVYDGAIIVSEPSTGKILAMVSKPDFDPNEINTIWDEVVNDKESTILLNRCVSGLYPPGSTFKIITALEYIRENPDSYQNYHYNCTGSIKIDDVKIKCYHGSVHGSEDFEKSFAKSCNSSFANIGMSLDENKFKDTLKELMFGEELPIKLASAKSNVIVSADMSTQDKMQTAIGQGKTQITPLHMNLITCSIANNGTLKTPYLIDHIENADGNTIKNFSEKDYRQLMTPEEATALTKLMVDVVEEGTASKLSGQSYTVAGKTGSAEYNNEKGDSHAWFTGFSPVEAPEICVTVIIEGAGSGGDYAVPIAKRLFDAYYQE